MNPKDLESIKTRLGKATAGDDGVRIDFTQMKQDIESLLREVERLKGLYEPTK